MWPDAINMMEKANGGWGRHRTAFAAPDRLIMGLV